MQVYFASSHELSVPIAQSLIERNLISGFISNSDRPSGRNRIITANGFAKWAQETGLPVTKPLNSAELKASIIEAKIDLVITCAYGKIIEKQILELPKFGWLNVHFSLLPKYRGAAPVQRALMNGEKKTGISIFKLDDGLDTGEILYSEDFEIPGNIGAKELLNSLSLLAAKKLPELLQNPESWKLSPQLGEPTFAPKISREENRIDWKQSTLSILNYFRGLEINGGVYSIFRNEKIQFIKLTAADMKLEIGEIRSENGKLFVGTGDRALEILELKPSGKSSMSAKDWINGARLSAGEKFE